MTATAREIAREIVQVWYGKEHGPYVEPHLQIIVNRIATALTAAERTGWEKGREAAALSCERQASIDAEAASFYQKRRVMRDAFEAADATEQWHRNDMAAIRLRDQARSIRALEPPEDKS